ncbi:nucleotidyltransferase domain-containing protein [Butyrivibrio sp. WCD3002]|uniref:nucleotidyltransferase domain-containing protein n=1 Tax=Butyrivibrio sp. WCD3002 TaxID=1280676 RepID=UPI0003FEAEC7|nr:nucleotidyltransferase domain-containing protein [Butyrivibrio sp. WCD3002]
MCKVTEMTLDNRTVNVADIKHKYISNIVDSAKKCSFIDKIILFGSSIDERCTEDSDIDLAIFGNQTRYKCLNSKEYRQFAENLYSFDNFSQSYDLLYFKTGNTYSGLIINDINNGEVLYVREGE